MKPRLGVLVSGGGTTLENFLDLEGRGELAGEVALVVSSDPAAGACERARKAGKPLEIVEWGKGASEAVTKALLRERVDLVLMAGFLRLYRFPEEFSGRVLNIHPSLLPAFGGKGMWGPTSIPARR